MYLWQRLASPSWWEANEDSLRIEGDTDLAIIEKAGRKRLTLEIACPTRARANVLRRHFGGRVTKLRPDWLKRFSSAQKSKPLRIGERLVITNPEGASSSPRSRGLTSLSLDRGRWHIVIPAGAAFGTGQHSTTAMSLRLLEQLTRTWNAGWPMVDLGTGSGILALAAKRLGGGRVAAIDVDPVAISTAKGNARLNRINGIDFRVADVRKWRLPAAARVLTANLFSDLLIEILPKLRRPPWLILSGIMREQEEEVLDALRRHRISVEQVRRRGRWIAIVAKTG